MSRWRRNGPRSSHDANGVLVIAAAGRRMATALHPWDHFRCVGTSRRGASGRESKRLLLGNDGGIFWRDVRCVHSHCPGPHSKAELTCPGTTEVVPRKIGEGGQEPLWGRAGHPFARNEAGVPSGNPGTPHPKSSEHHLEGEPPGADVPDWGADQVVLHAARITCAAHPPRARTRTAPRTCSAPAPATAARAPCRTRRSSAGCGRLHFSSTRSTVFPPTARGRTARSCMRAPCPSLGDLGEHRGARVAHLCTRGDRIP